MWWWSSPYLLSRSSIFFCLQLRKEIKKSFFFNLKKWLSFSVTDIVDIAIQVRGLIVYMDQLLVAVGTRKLVGIIFLVVFAIFIFFSTFLNGMETGRKANLRAFAPQSKIWLIQSKIDYIWGLTTMILLPLTPALPAPCQEKKSDIFFDTITCP